MSQETRFFEKTGFLHAEIAVYRRPWNR